MADTRQGASLVTEQVDKAILGKKEQVREIMLAFLAGGHILLTDIPGVGKTTMALAFAKAMDLEYRRMQFTPDVMPSDLTGFSVYRRDEEKFVYQPGIVFCNLLLADEINRTSPKTQSALLEVMEEGNVTVDGVTRPVPDPFLVIATQNPAGAAGTQMLPEAQMDRFIITLTVGYPAFEDEVRMAQETGPESRIGGISRVAGKDDLKSMQAQIHDVYLKDNVARYIVDLVTATRSHPHLERGASPRATLSLVKMAKAAAWYEGRDFVTPADVAGQFPYVATHRVVRNASAKMEGKDTSQILTEIVEQVRKPPMGDRHA